MIELKLCYLTESDGMGELMCSCLRDPQSSTIQDFNSETDIYHDESFKNVIINNCSASHYTVLIQERSTERIILIFETIAPFFSYILVCDLYFS